MDRSALVAALKSRLSLRDLDHSVRVSRVAAELAEAHGLDVGKCAAAALMHDYARGMTHRQLIDEAERFDIPVTHFERHNPYLLHARVGAVLLKADGLIDDPEVLQAIARHTLGATDMTDIDLAVFVSDHIEPHRSNPQIAEIKQAALADLASGARECFSDLICGVIKKRGLLHPDGVAAWNSLVDRTEA